jgi:hypothetical protein
MADITSKLGLESVDATPANDYLTETEVFKTYGRLKRVADFYALWLSYEMLMETENTKYLKVQQAGRKLPGLLKDTPSLAKSLEGAKLSTFVICDEARKMAKESHLAACKFYDQHWKPLAGRKLTKPQEASLGLVTEKMTGGELEEIITILRSQCTDFMEKLNR